VTGRVTIRNFFRNATAPRVHKTYFYFYSFAGNFSSFIFGGSNNNSHPVLCLVKNNNSSKKIQRHDIFTLLARSTSSSGWTGVGFKSARTAIFLASDPTSGNQSLTIFSNGSAIPAQHGSFQMSATPAIPFDSRDFVHFIGKRRYNNI